MNHSFVIAAASIASFIIPLAALVIAYQLTHRSVAEADRPALLMRVFIIPFLIAIPIVSGGLALTEGILAILGPGG